MGYRHNSVDLGATGTWSWPLSFSDTSRTAGKGLWTLPIPPGSPENGGGGGTLLDGAKCQAGSGEVSPRSGPTDAALNHEYETVDAARPSNGVFYPTVEKRRPAGRSVPMGLSSRISAIPGLCDKWNEDSARTIPRRTWHVLNPDKRRHPAEIRAIQRQETLRMYSLR